MQVIVSNKVNEYFNVTEKLKDYIDYDQYPDHRPILVSKWSGAGNSYQGNPISFSLRSTKYLKGALRIVRETEVLNNPTNYFNKNLFKEFDMNVPQLIEAGNTFSTIEEIENAIRVHQAILIDRAIRKAEQENEFVAMANLSNLRDIYPAKKGRIVSGLADKDKKTALEVSIKTDKTVDDRLVEIVFNKGKKIGSVVIETASNIVLLIRKADADAYVKATQAIKGFVVDSKKQAPASK